MGGQRLSFFGETDQVFPHLASGGGWETVMVIVNMSTAPMDFVQRFYTTEGKPMSVTFRTIPEGKLITATAASGSLPPNSSFNLALFDSTPETVSGWGTLNYDASKGRLGAYAILRQRTGTGASFEALVPLSSYEDTQFFMPFDNIQGFTTAMALANPASNLANSVTIRALALNGSELGNVTLTIPPSGQVSFVVADKLPATAGRMGTLYVESSVTRLSAMGIRFNESNAFATIPIMNWADMF